VAKFANYRQNSPEAKSNNQYTYIKMKTIECARLLADLWWIEYQEAVKDAQLALQDGDKLKALTLAIWAHKTKREYEYYANRLIFN
jgi:hypothetical protein